MDRNYIARELTIAAKEVQGRFNFPPEIARLERKFESSIQSILGGISDYEEIMEKLANLDEYPDAVEIGKRGAQTARQRNDSWRAIADDFYVLSRNMQKRERQTGSYMV